VCGLLALVGHAAGAIGTHTVGAVAGASHLMRHRGPDEPGTWSDDRVVLGFNRLSIIDISHSHQPLRWGPPTAPGRYVLVFNGEIYNYLELRAELAETYGARFATDGDGEAIVAAYHYWGIEALGRLRGMFAFALWDTEAGELFCARDPFGIKPLFMATGPGGTAVGSEEKCLLDLAGDLGLDLDIDPRALQHYTVLQYVPEPETLHRGVRRLESGSYAVIRPGFAPEVNRYFRPRFAAVAFRPGTEQARYDEITAVLEDSVAKHMRADNARLYVSGRNLATWTNYTGYNPDVNSAGTNANLSLGVDFYAYPLARTWTMRSIPSSTSLRWFAAIVSSRCVS
jgi:asparagine synthase (glutamine-hydrolysing)